MIALWVQPTNLSTSSLTGFESAPDLFFRHSERAVVNWDAITASRVDMWDAKKSKLTQLIWASYSRAFMQVILVLENVNDLCIIPFTKSGIL